MDTAVISSVIGPRLSAMQGCVPERRGLLYMGVSMHTPAQRTILACIGCTEVPCSHMQAVCWDVAIAMTFLSFIALLIT